MPAPVRPNVPSKAPSRPVVVVGFLQNQWFKDPERMARIRQDEHWRDKPNYVWNRTWLFWGCLTGRRLQAAFTEEVCDRIIWEETSLVMAGKSNACPPPSIPHMKACIQDHKPDIIIAFGKVAMYALSSFDQLPEAVLLFGPHPAARGADVPQQLAKLSKELQRAEARLRATPKHARRKP